MREVAPATELLLIYEILLQAAERAEKEKTHANQ